MLLVPLDGILCAELQVVVAHLEVGLEYTGTAVGRDYGVGVGEVAEEVAHVGTDREALEQISAHAHIGLRDVAFARAAVGTVGDRAGKRIAYVGVGEQPDATGHVAAQRELHDDVVERSALRGFAQLPFVSRDGLVGKAYVEEEGERVHTDVGGGVHYVDLPVVVQGITYAAHSSLGSYGIVAEYTVSESGIGRGGAVLGPCGEPGNQA